MTHGARRTTQGGTDQMPDAESRKAGTKRLRDKMVKIKDKRRKTKVKIGVERRA
jgi:hypothetical protein